jgi:hypothetical protein
LEHEASPYPSLLPLTVGGDGMEIQARSCSPDVVAELEGQVPDAEEPMVEKSLA